MELFLIFVLALVFVFYVLPFLFWFLLEVGSVVLCYQPTPQAPNKPNEAFKLTIYQKLGVGFFTVLFATVFIEAYGYR